MRSDLHVRPVARSVAGLAVLGLALTGCSSNEEQQPSSEVFSLPPVTSSPGVSAFTDYSSHEELIQTAVDGGVPCTEYQPGDEAYPSDVTTVGTCWNYDANGNYDIDSNYDVWIFESAQAAGSWFETFVAAGGEATSPETSYSLRGVTWMINCTTTDTCQRLEKVVGGALA